MILPCQLISNIRILTNLRIAYQNDYWLLSNWEDPEGSGGGGSGRGDYDGEHM